MAGVQYSKRKRLLAGAPANCVELVYQAGKTPDFEGTIPVSVWADLRQLLVILVTHVEPLVDIIAGYLYGEDVSQEAYENELIVRILAAEERGHEPLIKLFQRFKDEWHPDSQFRSLCPLALCVNLHLPAVLRCPFQHQQQLRPEIAWTRGPVLSYGGMAQVRFEVNGNRLDSYGMGGLAAWSHLTAPLNDDFDGDRPTLDAFGAFRPLGRGERPAQNNATGISASRRGRKREKYSRG